MGVDRFGNVALHRGDIGRSVVPHHGDSGGSVAPHCGDSGRSVVPHLGVHSRWALLWGNSDLPWRRLTLA